MQKAKQKCFLAAAIKMALKRRKGVAGTEGVDDKN